MIINFGCGLKKIPGTINVDFSDIVNPDVKWDLSQFPYPFKDNSADKILMNHVMEHLDNIGMVLQECNRILKWDGTLIVAVPHHSHDLALGDRYHRRIITVETFYHGSCRSGEDIEASMNYNLYLEKQIVRFSKNYGWMAKAPKFLSNFCTNHLRNFARESEFILRKIKKHITLSFDDGPSEYTTYILDVLKEAEVKAAFFVLGENIATNLKTIKQIVDEGHEIGIHGFSHAKWMNKEIIKEEVSRSLEILKDVLPDYTVKYFRPPYVQSYAKLYPENLKIPELKNMICVDYTTSCVDWENGTTVFDIVNNTMKTVTDNGMILLHDGSHKDSKYTNRMTTCEAVMPLISTLRNSGYVLSTLRELEERQYGRIVPEAC